MPQFAEDHKLGPAARGFKSGPIITVPGGYPDNVWHGNLNYEVATPDEARAAVADLVDRGADVIKIALEPGGQGTWPTLDLQQVKTIVEEAHTHGILVRAHIGRSDVTDVLGIVLESGVDVIEHIPPPVYSTSEAYDLVKEGGRYTLTSADEAQLARLAAQHVIMVPTISAYTPWCETLDLNSQLKQTCYNLFQEPVRRFHALGGTVVLGNDYNANDRNEKGVPLREMQLLLEAGLTPMEVIESGTRDAARVCGHDDELGTLEPGKLADVVIVDGDPLVNIEAIRQVIVVIKGGQIVFPIPAATN
jgi:enamidase